MRLRAKRYLAAGNVKFLRRERVFSYIIQTLFHISINPCAAIAHQQERKRQVLRYSIQSQKQGSYLLNSALYDLSQ
jgi:hypothetical protein